ncbi:hypothetical protein C8E89_10368 [Mycolicibacterium moriokaense]|uniref:Uncharacterized protein n=1 Tax=Mycolicibacterium moriokaense TaxID=39691 RepID=A0A318HKQ5_9MYCO|nr:hypothetical protein C8E89_10368 [Mycolicibacterium moriokaense]
MLRNAGTSEPRSATIRSTPSNVKNVAEDSDAPASDIERVPVVSVVSGVQFRGHI